MKFFRHYKNKPYKYIGVAKHTESMDDLVIYETRYENEVSRVWARPKQMFFESVEFEGQKIPRFQEVPLEIKTTVAITEAEVQIIAPIIKEAFGEWDPEWFYSRLNNHRKFHLAIGYMEGKPVGFKLGYELDRWEFYSWLGAVLPEYRGLGVAKGLMKAQHQWCVEQGYKKIQTKTQNRFREMLLLNITQGFEIIGTHRDEKGDIKIILERQLT